MKPMYWRDLKPKPAVADVWVVDNKPDTALITRINVPIEHRRKGIGTELLKEIIADADKEGIVLYIEVQASDGPNRDILKRWYMKYGFESTEIFEYFLVRHLQDSTTTLSKTSAS